MFSIYYALLGFRNGLLSMFIAGHTHGPMDSLSRSLFLSRSFHYTQGHSLLSAIYEDDTEAFSWNISDMVALCHLSFDGARLPVIRYASD